MPAQTELKRLLILMAKEPVPGGSKTRLAPPLSAVEAADLYDAFLQDKVAQMYRVNGVERAIAFLPASGRGYFERLAPQFRLIEQHGALLSARLTNVFDRSFTEGYDLVLAIDGDTPTLPPSYLQAGFEALEAASVDVVLGPCRDGGYYAIGMKEPCPGLFDVQMSTSSVTRDTLSQAEAAGLTVHCLPTWFDIDRPEDLEHLVESLNEASSEPGYEAPATRQQLQISASFEAEE
jgi:rSAM/selenodomain-associated transferase 1